MSDLEDKKKIIIDKIVDVEEKMFVSVRTKEPADCQSMLKTFRTMRSMSFSVLEIDTLNSYLEDLKEAEKSGRNLVMEKYARMDNLIPVINDSEIISGIVQIETEWMNNLHRRYPFSVNFDDRFRNYETGELETYSDHTLGLYYRDLLTAYNNGLNLCEKRYLNLYKELGYSSLEEVEKAAILKLGG
ncbi:MAG: DUF4125 family protein [Acidaminococcaceae bacterium]